MSFFSQRQLKSKNAIARMPPSSRAPDRRGCAPPSFLFLSSLRTRGSSIVVFVFVFPLSVILDACPPTLVNPVNRGSSVVLFERQEEAKTLDPRSVGDDKKGSSSQSGRLQARLPVSNSLRQSAALVLKRSSQSKTEPGKADSRFDSQGREILRFARTRNKRAPTSRRLRGRNPAKFPNSPCGGEDCLSAALVLSNAKELSINNRPSSGKADSFLRQTQDRR